MKRVLMLFGVILCATTAFALDAGDISTANDLMHERQSIQNAMDSFDAGGRIVSMTVAAPANPDHPTPPIGVIIPTGHIDYPPQMVTAIKAAFQARETAIDAQLGQLGVTGAETRKK